MAPESLMDNLYTSKGDVWSFGVLLWEIVTLGCLPYPGIPGADLARMLHSGYRMGKPDHCTQQVYAIMQKCWQAEPGDRPSFEDLVQILQPLAASEELYVDISDFREDVHVNTAEIGQGEKC
ncbi:tyrosine kinase receptor Cad96Ca-like [Lingula anatina]|uniref:Tyrosine kinase receptor Cad96Ca-like n=1 Tax=Lingula anatina TaxID=7574 RepID=A0A2R2MSN9_LINAN|nr:tyrosine kinase receptor Cad96Ca-like [Lingula anatina]|eukprot:XP_023933017.1 tyrosine kinase receptor Cad96Ca-like [Lingula anatina]